MERPQVRLSHEMIGKTEYEKELEKYIDYLESKVNGTFTADLVKEAYNDGYEDARIGYRDFKIDNYR